MSETATLDQPQTARQRNRVRYTGRQSGIRGIAAAALLRDGQSANQTAKITGLSYEVVTAIRDRWSQGLELVEPIRKTLRDVGVLTAAELLFGISEQDIERMNVKERIEMAIKLMDKYAAPEPSPQHPFVQILNQYNLQPSHSASQRTIEPKTPQSIESSASAVKQINELEGK